MYCPPKTVVLVPFWMVLVKNGTVVHEVVERLDLYSGMSSQEVSARVDFRTKFVPLCSLRIEFAGGGSLLAICALLMTT